MSRQQALVALLLLAVVPGAGAQAPKGDLSVAAVASTTGSYTGIDDQVSINDSGWIAFTGLDSAGVNGLFVWRPGFPDSRIGTGGPATDQYVGTAINSAGNPRVASRLRESGPTFKARKFPVLSAGSESVGQSPTHFDSCQSFVALNDVGVMTFNALQGGVNKLMSGFSSPPVTLASGTAGGSAVRPAISNTDLVAYRNFDAGSIRVVQHPAGAPVSVATGFTNLGREPGISSDGRVVAFAANIGLPTSGVYIAVADGASWQVVKVGGNTGDGFLGFDDQRVGVSSTGQPDGLDGQRVTLVFGAERASGRGVHALRVRLKRAAVGSTIEILGIERHEVALVGQAIGTRTLDDYRLWDPLADSGWIGFRGTLSGGVQAVLRSYLVPCLDVDGDGSADDDADFLCDNWEISGIDADGDGVVDLPLHQAPFSADPDVKDLFVEIDYMDDPATGHGEQPLPASLEDVRAAMAASPVLYPDGTTGRGIVLHAMVDEAVPHAAETRWGSRGSGRDDDYLDFKSGSNDPADPGASCGTRPQDAHFGTPADRMASSCEAILGARRLTFRYALFVHRATTFGSAGLSRPLGVAELKGNDLVIGLGAQTDEFFSRNCGALGRSGETPLQCGLRTMTAGTFMHELGHTIGLDHGGHDSVNCKPNHQSIMNYAVCFPSIVPSRDLDFSLEQLLPLIESALDETRGTGTARTYGVPHGVESLRPNRPCVPGVACKARLSVPGAVDVDWNNDRRIDALVTDIDVNRMGDLCPGTGEVLAGSNDWGIVSLSLRETEYFADLVGGAPSDEEPGMTADAIMELALVSDADEDGIPNALDNCPGFANPLQLDADADGYGDGCQPPGGPDATPPVVDAVVTPPPNAAGWHSSDVSIEWSVDDSESGISMRSGCDDVEVTAETAALTLTCSATNGAGLSSAASVVIRLDRTPPTINGAAAPAPNAAGWNATDVTVSFTCADSLSGIDACGPAVQVIAAEGAGQARSATAVDVAGNVATATVGGINVDKTPPTIEGARTPPPNSAGWNNTDVTVTFACADALSGVSSCGPSPQIVATEGSDQWRSGQAVDLAGNASASLVDRINIDKTPPSMSCSPVPSVLWPPNHRMVDVTLAVDVVDALSGPAGFVLVRGSQDEPDDGLGDGDFPGDIDGADVGAADTVVTLRAERSGTGDGRSYTLEHRALDLADNAATCVSEITVPHSRPR